MQTVAIFGVPRSGTSWLGQIFNSSPNVAYRYQPIFAYSFEGSISAESSSEEITEFHNLLLKTNDDFVCQTQNISGNKTPSFQKQEITHLVWKEVRFLDIIPNLIEQSDTKVIGIVRHPCGTIHSWHNAPKEFEDNWDLRKEWRQAPKKNENRHDFYGYERWIESTQMFLELQKQAPDQFKLVGYEQLVRNPHKNTQELYDFTDLSFGEQTEKFLKASTSSGSDDPYGVYRKNKTGFEWINSLDPVIINEIKNDPRFIAIEKHFGWNILEQKNQ